MKKYKPFLVSILLFVVTTVAAVSAQYGAVPENAIAQSTSTLVSTTMRLTGYAWSENIGWISFKDISSSGSENIVEVKTDGSLEGYAWSEHIGWVQFGGLSEMPDSAGNARIVGTTLAGWARAVAAVGGINTGGWDGWISLSGTSAAGTPYGVSVIGNKLASYAWGSDVVGWVDFSGVSKIAQLKSCIGPDGITIPHGSSHTYKTVGAGGVCTGDEQRSCNDGVLSGTFTTPGSCGGGTGGGTGTSTGGGGTGGGGSKDCFRAGRNLTDGQSGVFYTKAIAGLTETCNILGENLTCVKGDLMDTSNNPDTIHKYAKCIPNPAFREN